MRRLVFFLGAWIAATQVVATELPLKDVKLDRSAEAVHRGAKIVTDVCMGCHSLKYLRYRDLRGAGLSAEEIAKIQGDRRPEDAMLSVMDDETSIATFGRIPPDQSTLAKARPGGALYIYSFVTSFDKNPEGDAVNRLIPTTKMPDVLGYAISEGAERAATEQMIQDAAVFLEWASDPRAAERKTIGKFVLGYLVVLTFLLYLIKRRVWKTLPP